MCKVLFIHHGSEKGGAPISLLYTAVGVEKYGYEPIIGLVRPTEGLHRLYNEVGLKTIEITKVALYIFCSSSNFSLYHPRAYIKLVRYFKDYRRGQAELEAILKTENIDLVHLNSMALSSSANLLTKVNFPYVWHVREYGPRIKDFRLSRLASAMRRAPAVIFLSQAERKSWVGTPPRNSTVVYNFVDLNSFKPSEKAKGSRKKILFVGGLKENKGAELLIDILGVLKKRGIDFQCLMPGSLSNSEVNPGAANTTFEQKILDRSVTLGVYDHLDRSAFNPDIRPLFADCDVLLFPAKVPHFARPIVEASAMEKPVVATALPPLDEQVIDGKTGFLVPYDADSFADKIALVFEDEGLAARMGKAGRLLIEENFSSVSQIAKIVAVYEKILS
jgi:glycosyltransferase involved in cell wall biosynthesis